MGKYYKIEVSSYSSEIYVDNFEKIDFGDYEEMLSSVFSGFYLYEVDEEDESLKKLVAKVYGRFFDLNYAIDHQVSFYDVFDMADGDSASLIPYLVESDDKIKEKFLTLNNNVYYLDRIFVEEEYRGRGIAKFILNNILDILKYVSKIEFGVLIVQAQPYDKIDGESIMDYEDKDRLERLIKLYEDCSFIRIDKSNYLYLLNE